MQARDLRHTSTAINFMFIREVYDMINTVFYTRSQQYLAT